MAFQRSEGIYIKRVIGLPEEDIKIIEYQVYINELPLTDSSTTSLGGLYKGLVVTAIDFLM